MGEVVLAAKVTHVPSMFISEMPGDHEGCRQPAIDGLREIGKRARALGATSVVVFDTHWLVNSGYHINCNKHHQGLYTSSEFPHFIRDLEYDYPGEAALGQAIADIATADGVLTRAHTDIPSLGLEYGTLVPLHYMQASPELKVVVVAGWCYDADFDESRIVGQAVRQAIERSDEKVVVLASGSLSHRIWDNRSVEQGLFKISRPFNEAVDHLVLDMWQTARTKEFLEILPDYAKYCNGEGGMHDTAMLFSVLGWDQYKGHAEILTEYFPSSGTGQCNVVFPL
ncbi:MAG: 3,4-dihydroxyphenylacetate 2,3-dioxygenase [Proteobacteria bacterium]|jgi:3,4-dihydroxyphenylacetate 2,3-dioxygenase|nr:3,4-dihydroxyphenylacetate 2,3-dioxygenase [Pseudomonadota bacterium]HJP06841.1 3,4-dihydroxyphenylacetate 2,3-dioxygenase [Arenicellales bacterium]|tara:strand:+ start:7883 stop:8731 length:849 start_codon:yes stop_codon:yes gene_type:complete